MNCYLIRTTNQRSFIIEADTSEKAIEKVEREVTHQCPWTKKAYLVEPKLKVTLCINLNKRAETKNTPKTNPKKPAKA